MRYLFLFTLTLLLTSGSAYAQIFRHYLSTDLEMAYEKDEEWKKKIRERTIEFEQYFANEFLFFENDDNAIKHVQVVFNILQTEDKKVTYDQIKQQLKALNAAFNNEIKMPEDDFYKDLAYNAGIQFCVPDFNENFIRTKTFPKGTEFKEMFSERGEKGIAAMEPDKYINIWVADLGQYNPQGQEFSVAGYAQLPMRDSLKDGIVIDIDHFGEQPNNELYSKGYTLPHLMGIYLGIGPLWGFYGDGQCGGDFVADTPTHPGPSLICLPQTENQLVVSSCWGNERMMNKNFMDNVPDDCAAMFTLGQRRKMHANLGKKGPRGYLIPTEPFTCNDGKTTAVLDNEITKMPNVRVMPNPAYSQITIRLEGSDNKAYYRVFNTTGQLMTKGEMESTSQDVNVSEWPAGMYYLMVNQHQNNISNVQKVTFEVMR